MKRLFMLAIAVLFVVFGLTAYPQNENAKIYREEKNKMHRELMKQRKETPGCETRSSKTQTELELERKNAEEILNKARNRK